MIYIRKSNNFGFSLIEVIASSAIAIVFIVIVAGAFVQINEGLNRRRISMSRDTTAVLIRKNLSNMKALRATMKEVVNKPFYDCVCNSGVACQNMNKTPLIVYDSPGNLSTVYFNNLGFACPAKSPACVIEVVYTVAAQCPPNPFPSPNPIPTLTCLGPAEFILIEYQIQKNLTNLDPKIDFKTISGKVYYQISEIAPAGAGICP